MGGKRYRYGGGECDLAHLNRALSPPLHAPRPSPAPPLRPAHSTDPPPRELLHHRLARARTWSRRPVGDSAAINCIRLSSLLPSNITKDHLAGPLYPGI
uniref:Uncharacterized protein n=1 Tax=Oryza punctata TaxID=4537 RepID=A0A0E0LNA2_ORYPU